MGMFVDVTLDILIRTGILFMAKVLLIKKNLLVLKIGTEDPSGNIWGSMLNGTVLYSGGASLKILHITVITRVQYRSGCGHLDKCMYNKR